MSTTDGGIMRAITKRWTGEVLYRGEHDSLRAAVEAAVRSDANLDGANLDGAYLARANLAGANLTGANLTGANLDGANLAGAYLAGAYLDGAYLTGAYLARANLAGAYLDGANLDRAYLAGAYLARADLDRAYLARANLAGANLTGANLTDANLAGANLDRAYLTRANLARANLTGANLDGAYLARANLARANLARADLAGVRDDLFEVLAAAPRDVPGLLAAVREGRVDGTVYEGECACLVGTIANVRGCHYTELADLCDLRPDSSRPAERWFLALTPGKTPENDPVAAITAAWIEDWISARPDPAPESEADK